MKHPSIFVHIPAHLLEAKLPYFLNNNLQPELACQNVGLDQLDFKRLGECAARLAEAGLKTVLHAPFRGFAPGDRNTIRRDDSRRIAEQSLLLAQEIKAVRVIFHPGIDTPNSQSDAQRWFDLSLPVWSELTEMAADIGTIACIENIYESRPDHLLAMIEAIASPAFGHVFDIGHWNLFADISLEQWLEQIGGYIRHLHLHDNCSDADDHQELGAGNIDFTPFMSWLRQQEDPPTVTLENRTLDKSELSLPVFMKMFEG